MTAGSPRGHNARSLCIDKGSINGHILDRKIHKPHEASGGILRVGKWAARFLGRCDRPVEGNAVCLPLGLTSRFTRTLTTEGRGRITVSFFEGLKKKRTTRRRKAEKPKVSQTPRLIPIWSPPLVSSTAPNVTHLCLQHSSPSFDLSIPSSSLPVDSEPWRTDTHSP